MNEKAPARLVPEAEHVLGLVAVPPASSVST